MGIDHVIISKGRIMSTVYRFSFRTEIINKLPTESQDVFDFLMGHGGQPPTVMPDHPTFKNNIRIPQFNTQYRHFPPDSYRCATWEETRPPGRHIDLYLPGVVFGDIYDCCLPLASWLASISLSEGAVGGFQMADYSDFNPTLLFIFKKELYLGDGNEAHSFLTGEPLAWPSI